MSKSIAVLGSDQVPLAYTVPVPGTLTPLAASATFDGTAAGAFLPCVSYYDNDGNLITRATAPEVAAGSSAGVSWFPGGGLGAGTGATPAASAYLWTQTTKTFTNGVGFAATWDHFQTTDASVFGTNPFNTFTLPPHNTAGDVNLVLLQAGAFVAEATAIFAAGSTNFAAEIQMNTINYLDNATTTAAGNLATRTAPCTGFGAIMTQSVRCFTIPAGDEPNGIYFEMNGDTVGTYTVTAYSLVCHWLGAGIGTDDVVY